jgi:muramoyltetrapeptide carboxypeptidase
LITFLGMEFFTHAKKGMAYELASMRQAWFAGGLGKIKPNHGWTKFDDNPTLYKGWQCIKPGKAAGRLIGGNFSSYIRLLNTKYLPELTGNILLLETYKFSKQQIHSALMSLRLQGVFQRIAGLIIGYCAGSDNPDVRGNQRPIKDVLLETTAGYDFPILEIGEFGHKVDNIMMPIGAQAKLNATEKKFKILEKLTV